MSNSDQKTVISGPFGRYEHGSTGALLNACCEIERVPLQLVESFQIGNGKIFYRNAEVAAFRWMDEITNPLISWRSPDFRTYSRQVMMLDKEPIDDKEQIVLRPKFRLTLSCHDMACFEISGRDAVPELFDFLKGMLTNLTTDPRYKIHTDAGAFFQGGYADPNGKWFLIEFWKPAGAQAFIDYLNENYKFIQEASDETEKM